MYAGAMHILSRPALVANHRIHYGSGPFQFGDLWLPGSRGRSPLVVFFHGGWWESEYDLGYAGYLCDALKNAGIATWSVEYRRVGSTGGGWPTTFQDAAAGFDHVVALSKSYPLDLSQVIAVGHSAGGHLAFWIAGRQHVPPQSEIFRPLQGVHLRGVVGLAGVVDLRLAVELAGHSIFAHDRDEVYALMGGSPRDVPKRYQAGNPGDLLPLQSPQFLIQGGDDEQIPPELPDRWVAMARLRGSQAAATIIAGADHFDIVDPESKAWPVVLQKIKMALES